MQILVLLGMYIDAVVVLVTSQTLLVSLALAILWQMLFYQNQIVKKRIQKLTNSSPRNIVVDPKKQLYNQSNFCYPLLTLNLVGSKANGTRW